MRSPRVDGPPEWRAHIVERIKVPRSPSTDRALCREIGARLQRRRLEYGLTQADVARAIGASQKGVAGWEAGRCAMSVANLVALCTALGVPPDYLLGWGEKDSSSAGSLP